MSPFIQFNKKIITLYKNQCLRNEIQHIDTTKNQIISAIFNSKNYSCFLFISNTLFTLEMSVFDTSMHHKKDMLFMKKFYLIKLMHPREMKASANRDIR